MPVHESAAMQQVMKLVDKISQVDVTCLLTGESGTGKTMLGKYMHLTGPRAEKPFISLNCACLPTSLLESELFGYAKGAFTGAQATGKKGLIELAHEGTLLLDEISELSLAAQAKLLHFLQDKTFVPVGGNTQMQVDVRIIAATNKNLRAMVELGQFREDLFYRLHVVEVYVPPLRQRKKDILPLVQFFIGHLSEKYGVARQFSQEAMRLLIDAEWKGNVRELEHLVERLVVTGDRLVIEASHLPKSIFGLTDAGISPPNMIFGRETLAEKMEEFEKHIVCEAWRQHGSSRKVAQCLGVSQSKANNLIRKHTR